MSSTNARECPAPVCDVYVDPQLYSCRAHWWALPQGMRGNINRAWRAYAAHPTNANRDKHAAAKAVADAYLAERYPKMAQVQA